MHVRKGNDTRLLPLSCYFTDQALLYGRVLLVFLVQQFNLLCENVFLCILLISSAVKRQISMFILVYPWTVINFFFMSYVFPVEILKDNAV